MSRRPNIVLFLTDDHAPWTLPVYGNRSSIRLPHFGRFSEEGTVFQNAFTPCPVCSPARSCLMTGRTPSQVGIHDWLEESDPAIAERDWLKNETTLPERLHDAGYHTILSGKWHLGRSFGTPRGFDRCFGLPGGQGSHNGPYRYHQDGQAVDLDGNKSAIITERALAMLDDAPAGRPFFLNVGYIATHSPYRAEEHDATLVSEAEFLSLEDFPPYRAHPWVKNEDFQANRENESDELRRRYLGYYAAVLELDRNVGRVVSHLEKQGKLDNTIVVYVSDHGCSLGHQGFFGKGNSTRPLNMLDVSLRIPLLMRGPGIQRGGVVEKPVDHYDLFLALCEWAGAAPGDPGGFPGRSLVPLAQGETVSDWPPELFGEYGDLRMIRTPEFKFVHRYPDGPDELFDLRSDAGETVNLAGLSNHLETKLALERRLSDWYARHEDPVHSGLRVGSLPVHNLRDEAWRDGRREKVLKAAAVPDHEA